MDKVKLISFTTPSIPMLEDGILTMEDMIAYCARVSNPDNQYNTGTTKNLIKYLIRHKHWSPFEMVSICLEINTTRDIARQIIRHRSFTFQEFSQRYADANQLGWETREARLQDEKNRQNSLQNLDQDLEYWWVISQSAVMDSALDIYTQALRRGIAKEVARTVLPEGLTHSRLYMNGSLRSWFHYCQLRSGVETQKEHREIAQEATEVITNEVFLLFKELLENG